METRKPFNPNEAQWAQIRKTPGKLQHVEGIGPVLYAGDVTAARAGEIVKLMGEVHKHVGVETSVKGLSKKRPMIERCFVFLEDGSQTNLRDMTHQQFRGWAIAWLKRAGITSIEWGPPDTSAQERENVLRDMVKKGISPTMLLK
jgi:hypothetical protein